MSRRRRIHERWECNILRRHPKRTEEQRGVWPQGNKRIWLSLGWFLNASCYPLAPELVRQGAWWVELGGMSRKDVPGQARSRRNGERDGKWKRSRKWLRSQKSRSQWYNPPENKKGLNNQNRKKISVVANSIPSVYKINAKRKETQERKSHFLRGQRKKTTGMLKVWERRFDIVGDQVVSDRMNLSGRVVGGAKGANGTMHSVGWCIGRKPDESV